MDPRVEEFQRATAALTTAVARVIVGQTPVVEDVLTALFAGGHVLLEGAPGLGKTLLVRTLADAMSLRFSRIQFTPDLMPSDIVGTHVVSQDEQGRRRFELARGPIFGQLVLADEINRATPKTQSALLEAMAERSVTIAGTRHDLEAPFFVLATENPIEMEGTYPLPEAQLDRFLFKVLVPAPDEDTLVGIFGRTTGSDEARAEVVIDGPTLRAHQALVREVHVTEPLQRWVARLVRASDPRSASASAIARRAVRHGIGVRGGQSLLLAAKVRALMDGRAHVAHRDLLRVATPALRHRLILGFEAESEGLDADEVVRRLLDEVPATSEGVARLSS